MCISNMVFIAEVSSDALIHPKIGRLPGEWIFVFASFLPAYTVRTGTRGRLRQHTLTGQGRVVLEHVYPFRSCGWPQL